MGNAEQEAANRHVANQYIADWYFDFVSPFAYLQSEQLAALAPRITVRYKPVLFAGILGAHGQLGPAEIPAKRAFTYRFVLWQAKRLGIPLKLPHEHPFNPLRLLRLAIACDCRPEAIHRIFRFVWRDGRLPDLPIEWAELTQDLGLADADARIAEPEVKDTLRRHTDDAIALGVFGVPTLVLRGELFWGADATQMAADYAAAGCRWTDAEFARAAALPIGAARDAAKARRRT
jgi:2-hydroxychromene-2-carboxylate isomerase